MPVLDYSRKLSDSKIVYDLRSGEQGEKKREEWGGEGERE